MHVFAQRVLLSLTPAPVMIPRASLHCDAMLSRRVASALVAIFLLNLNWVSSRGACSDHRQGHESHGAHPAPSGVRHGADAPSPSHDHAPTAPAAERCCAALGSCSIAWTAERDADGLPAAEGSRRIPASFRHAPAIGLRAPEPPPPKA